VDHLILSHKSHDIIQNFFYAYSTGADHKKIKIVDVTFSTIAGIGSISLSKTLTLHNVLHVPHLS